MMHSTAFPSQNLGRLLFFACPASACRASRTIASRSVPTRALTGLICIFLHLISPHSLYSAGEPVPLIHRTQGYNH